MIDERVIKEARDRIIKLIYIMCRDYHLAEDVFQEACIKAHLSNNDYTSGGLYTISKNVLIDEVRGKYKKTYFDSVFDFDIFEVLAEEPQPDFDEKVEFQRKLRITLKALERLRPEQKEVVLNRLKGMMFKDMEGNVNTKIGNYRYAIINLKKILM